MTKTNIKPNQAGVPAGGTVGQVLTKDSGVDYEASFQTPGGGGGSIPNSGTASYDLNVPGVQNIPHGLGSVPSYIKMSGLVRAGVNSSSQGTYDGTTAHFITIGSASQSNRGTGQILYFSGLDNIAETAGCSITVDSTNIILTWTKSVFLVSSFFANMLWEAYI